jgi:hypothetical protein
VNSGTRIAELEAENAQLRELNVELGDWSHFGDVKCVRRSALSDGTTSALSPFPADSALHLRRSFV